MNLQTIHKIQQLLDRYYGGESNRQEEEELLDTLQGVKEELVLLPEPMRSDAELFMQMCGIGNLAARQVEEEAMQHLPAGFDERLQATLQNLEKSDLKVKGEARKSSVWMHYAAACASIIVVVGAAIGFMAMPNDSFRDTCSTTEQAEYQLNRALTLVSTFSSAGLSEARIDTEEQPVDMMTNSKFICFD